MCARPREALMSPQLTFFLWWLLLAAMLFYPVSKLIWVMSVRRLQKKLGRSLDDEELLGQKRRARVLAVILVMIVAFIYNIQTIGLPP